MKRGSVAGEIIFSPKDLIVFSDSPFASWHDRYVLEQPGAFTRDAVDDSLELAQERGIAHEKRFLDEIAREMGDLVDVSKAPDVFAATIEAIRTGRRVIYQAALRKGAFEGYADFLVRVERPSQLGPYSYEVWDTKLAHEPKPYFLIQLCAYAAMLEGVQGVRPREVCIVLGTGERRSFRTDDYFYYFLKLEERFLADQAAFDSRNRPVPDAHADHRHWTSIAEAELERRDHLSRVAGITRLQVRRLEESGVRTLAELATSTVSRVHRIEAAVVERLRNQARLQRQALEDPAAPPPWEMIAPDPVLGRRGFALLPPASDSDIFFDMEGFPYADGGGLEYLFGACDANGMFHDFWAHDRAQERRAFEQFVDFVIDRYRRDRSLHVYHYAAYEVSALRRLAGRHGTREDELDELLRGEVFIDVYKIFRQAIRFGAPSYSLKQVERLYRKGRADDVKTASDSMVAYARWAERKETADWRESPTLRGIRDYNEIDCRSTAELVAWLRERQRESGIAWTPTGAQAVVPAAPPAPKPATILAAQLLAQVPEDRSGAPKRWRVHELLAHLLEFHRREAKPVWWAMFDRAAMTEEELFDDLDCLAGLKRTGRGPRKEKRSLVYEYAFDPDQDTKLGADSKCMVAHDLSIKLTIASLDTEKGLIELKQDAKKASPPSHLSLIPDEFVSAATIEDSISRTVQAWATTGRLPRALDDFLHRRAPRLRGRVAGTPIVPAETDPVNGAVAAVLALDDSILCLQGPPGTGKTYAAARMAVALVRAGKRVAISSNSHEAILNLMGETTAAAAAEGVSINALKVGGDDTKELITSGRVGHVESMKELDFARAPNVVGGTAWAFSHPNATGQFDVLFVDEAGQVSVANLSGMAPAAKSVVLVGDQMQLSQPTKGSHPGESGLSVLDYFLEGRATIPRELGIFLDVTRRMTAEVCRFISGSIYEDRLQSHPCTEGRVVRVAAGGGRVLVDSGIVFVPVDHDGNAQSSDEETAMVAALVRELAGRTLVDEKGERPFTVRDALFVAPYNAQVRQLRSALDGAARVGSVDKFQGQEAPVVVVSMSASSGEASPRGIEFIFNPNRLNVAISRARSLAIVVACPKLAATRCRTVEQMRLVNLFCRILFASAEARQTRPVAGEITASTAA